MSTPKYFEDQPNVEWAISANKAGIVSYVSQKDYFHLLKVRDDVYREDTLYVEYVVKDGERPDQISYEKYGDNQFYWIILQINEIVDYYNQWPLSYRELEEYCDKKYGGSVGIEQVHHYETVETYDDDGNLILPGGLTVPENFLYEYPSSPGSNARLTSQPAAVTNFDYEKELNDVKSNIFILDPKYVYDYLREVRIAGINSPVQQSYITISDVIPYP